MTELAVWHTPPYRLQLQTNEIHVWQANVQTSDEAIRAPLALLSLDEQERASRFHFTADRNKYVFSRGLLRIILGNYLQVRPAELRFEYGGAGKPRLAKSQASLSFNVSHSGEIALYAFSRNRHIGVDVEFVRPDIEAEALAKMFFSPSENARLMKLPNAQRTLAFYKCWTGKEALMKASGLGLTMPPDQFDVSSTTDESGRLRIDRNSKHFSKWCLREIPVGRNYVAAIATRNDGDLKCWRWSSASSSGNTPLLKPIH